MSIETVQFRKIRKVSNLFLHLDTGQSLSILKVLFAMLVAIVVFSTFINEAAYFTFLIGGMLSILYFQRPIKDRLNKIPNKHLYYYVIVLSVLSALLLLLLSF